VITLDEAVDIVLDGACAACGAALPRPGEPCGTCGNLPPVTRPEATEALAAPGAVLAADAVREHGGGDAAAAALRKQALERQKEASDLLTAADRAEHVAMLERKRRAAQDQLGAALAAQEQATAAACAARGTGRVALEFLRDAQENHRLAAPAEETARRCRARAQAQSDALTTLQNAATVLNRAQAEDAAATAAVQAAEQALASAQAEVERREAGRDDAARRVQTPGRIPVSRERMAMDLFRLVLGGDNGNPLDPVDLAMAQLMLRPLASITGLEARMQGEARAKAASEHGAKVRSDLHMVRTPGGAGDVVLVDLGNPGRPR
jgi:hypothetical protein